MKSKNYYKEYKRGQVVYVDFGWKPNGVQGFIRPAVVVSADANNHCRAPQVTVCPLSSKLKDIKVHVKINPLDVNGLHLYYKVGKIKAAGGAIITVDEGSLGMNVKDREEVWL